MAVATGTALIVAGAVTAAAGATTGGIAANRAKKARIDADEEAAIKEQQLQDLVDSRPELNNPYDLILSDQDGIVSIEWGAYGVPESFLIYKNNIIKKIIGPINQKKLIEIKGLIK